MLYDLLCPQVFDIDMLGSPQTHSVCHGSGCAGVTLDLNFDGLTKFKVRPSERKEKWMKKGERELVDVVSRQGMRHDTWI